MEMYASKSNKSKVELYILKYCKVSIPKQAVRRRINVLVGVKKRVQTLSALAVNNPLNKIYTQAGPTISRTYPFPKEPKLNEIVDNPVISKINRVIAQYGAYLSCKSP